MQKPNRTVALFLRMMCAIALVMIGFAHKPAIADAGPDAYEMAAYVLPDGTIGSNCTSGDHHSSPEKAPGPDCEACRVSVSAVLPPPVDGWGHAIEFARIAYIVERRLHAGRRPFNPASAPRAPPSMPFLS